MTLLQLEYFQVMAKTLHYTRAAAQLHISQPSLSYALGQLESDLGVPLFQKEGKHVSLTAYGEAFQRSTAPVLQELDNCVKQVQAMREHHRQEIRLGYIQSLSAAFVPQLIEEYYRWRGAQDVSFFFAQNQKMNLPDAVRAGKLDLALSSGIGEGLGAVRILDQELVLLAPIHHPLAQESSISFSQLAGEPMVLLQRDTGLNATVRRLFETAGCPLQVAQEACDFNAAVNYVALGMGLSILPRTCGFDPHGVRAVEIRDVDCSRPIYLLWKGEWDARSPKGDFVAFLREYVQEHPGLRL